MQLFAESRLLHRSYSGSRPTVTSIRAGTAGNVVASDNANSARIAAQDAAIRAAQAAARQKEIDDAAAENAANDAANTSRTTDQNTRAGIIAAGGPKTTVGTSDYQAPVPVSGLSRDQKSAQSQAEATLQAQFLSDPSQQTAFQQISDYLTQLKTASPEEQAQIHSEMSAIANGLVDQPFDHRVQVEKDALTRKIRQLNDTYHELDSSEQLKLEQAVQNLDIDAAKDLNANFDDIFNRAGTSSGLLRRVADQIIETHDISEKQKEDTKNKTLEAARLAEQQDQENEQATRDENIYKIEQERTAARSSQLSDLVSEQEQNSLLNAQSAGAGNVQTPSSTTSPTISTIRSTPQQQSAAAASRGLSSATPIVATPDKPAPVNVRAPATTATANPVTNNLTPVQQRAAANAARLQATGATLNANGLAALRY